MDFLVILKLKIELNLLTLSPITCCSAGARLSFAICVAKSMSTIRQVVGAHETECPASHRQSN